MVNVAAMQGSTRVTSKDKEKAVITPEGLIKSIVNVYTPANAIF